MRALSLVGCRYFPRPSFDIRSSQFVARRLTSTGQRNSLTIVGKSVCQFDSLLGRFKATIDFRFNSTNMALNKLSIDKVDLAGKRVLIR